MIRRKNDRFKDSSVEIEHLTHEKDDKRLMAAIGEKKKNNKDKAKSKRVFLTDFSGDVDASETEGLREVVSALLGLATQEDEVIVRLESSGGMVHSYGLAATQLARLTDKRIPLTVCVDKVAASGGYMMACVANKIVSAPFAIIGSIGVVAQLPNFHRLLKKNDIDYELLTAGEYKRTLTMFGENTDKARAKLNEDLEDIHDLFKGFISDHRPQVDLPAVATGEIWFGKKAVNNQLVDMIQTSDEYLFDLRESADIYHIYSKEKKSLLDKLGLNIQAGVERGLTSFIQKGDLKFFS